MKTYEINFTCFEVTEPDGGGINSNHIAYFSSRYEAEKYVKIVGNGWPKNIREKTVSHRYTVLDTVEEKSNYDMELVKQQALRKLTQKEKQALGLE